MNLIKERAYSFYTEEFEDILKFYRRSPSISLAMKFVYGIQLISLMFTDEFLNIITSDTD